VLAAIGERPEPAVRREAWDRFTGEFPIPAEVDIDSTIIGGVDVEELRPRSPVVSTVLWFHGGGYVAGSLVTHRQFAARLAVAGPARVVNVAYHLAPEHPFPRALDDALDAYRGLLGAGVAHREIVVGGDSAGGGLAVAMLLGLRDACVPLPAGCVLIAPLVDMPGDGGMGANRGSDIFVRDGGGAIHEYIGELDPRDPRVSPYYGSLGGLPSIMLQMSADEALYAQCMRFAARVREVGGSVELDVWSGLAHTWQILIPECPEAGEAIARIGRFAARVTRPRSTPASSRRTPIR
jgi:acetyl esterase/lipase